MVLITILALVLLGVALMVFFGEKHAKPMAPKQQAKLSKIATYLVITLLIMALIRELI